MDDFLGDTSLKAHDVHVALLQKASVAKRLACMASLSQTTMNLSWRAIKRANPHYSKEEVNITFVALHYGEYLAKRLKQYLDEKKV